MNQAQLIEAIEVADIEYQDWLFNLLEEVEDKYVKGYLTAKADGCDVTTEAFRRTILHFVKSDIWGW